MKMFEKCFMLLIIIPVFLIISCSSTYNLYRESAEKNDSEVAVLYKDFHWGGGSVDVNSIQVTQIDDVQAPCKGIACLNRWFGSSWDGSYRIRLLPGEHAVHFRFKANHIATITRNGRQLRGYPKFKYTLQFTAEAGHKYYIAAEYYVKEQKARAWIEDTSAKKQKVSQ